MSALIIGGSEAAIDAQCEKFRPKAVFSNRPQWVSATRTHWLVSASKQNPKVVYGGIMAGTLVAASMIIKIMGGAQYSTSPYQPVPRAHVPRPRGSAGSGPSIFHRIHLKITSLK